MENKLISHKIQFCKTSNFETILTIRQIKKPINKVELKFETIFSGAKDPKATQTKAQFFVDIDELLHLRDILNDFGTIKSKSMLEDDIKTTLTHNNNSNFNEASVS